MPLSTLSKPEVRLLENWSAHKRIGADGAPILPPAFVAKSGPRVWVIDIRDDDSLCGPQGHIPGSSRIPFSRIGELGQLLGPTRATVLICDDGQLSRTGALYLNQQGPMMVAAMEGGMRQWKAEGYAVSRDSAMPTRWVQEPLPEHGSDGRPLVAIKPSNAKHLTKELVLNHIGDVHRIRKVKLSALFTASQTSCIDGREDNAIIGTPGGDAGELMLGLAAAELVIGRTLSQKHLNTVFRAFSDNFGGIYLHTDNHALGRLANHLNSDPMFSPFLVKLNSLDMWRNFLHFPPTHLRAKLLDYLLEPNHIGCGHLKLALTHADAYGVRQEVVAGIFRAFFEEYWRGASNLNWVILGGEHTEGAVVNVTMEGSLSNFSQIPMIHPSVGGLQMFVHHPQAIAALRIQTAQFMHNELGQILSLNRTHSGQLREVITKLGAEQTLATFKALAGGLPIFSLHFDGVGGFTLEENGHVPVAAHS